jgi:hypothetical protein
LAFLSLPEATLLSRRVGFPRLEKAAPSLREQLQQLLSLIVLA